MLTRKRLDEIVYCYSQDSILKSQIAELIEHAEETVPKTGFDPEKFAESHESLPPWIANNQSLSGPLKYLYSLLAKEPGKVWTNVEIAKLTATTTKQAYENISELQNQWVLKRTENCDGNGSFTVQILL